MCNCWSRNTTSMAGGTSPGRHGVVCAGIGLVGESRQTRCSVAGIGLVSILCMCKESEYHKYGRRGEYRQTRCSVAGIVLARFMSGNKDRATETYARVPRFHNNIMRMLNGEEPIYMNPWIKGNWVNCKKGITKYNISICYFSGYQGSIQRVDDNTYVISGEVSKLSATQVVITELPLGISVRNYRESVMENLLHGSEKIPPLITGSLATKKTIRTLLYDLS
jgi:hypothetical protein